MFIFKSTGLRGPAYPEQTQYVDSEGTQYPYTPRELLEEIPEPLPPADWKADEFITAYQDTAPYAVFTRRPQEVIDAMRHQEAKAAARAYLTSTDWLVTRKAETGHPIPDEVSTKRAEARALL